jgi:hypothetical protein
MRYVSPLLLLVAVSQMASAQSPGLPAVITARIDNPPATSGIPAGTEIVCVYRAKHNDWYGVDGNGNNVNLQIGKFWDNDLNEICLAVNCPTAHFESWNLWGGRKKFSGFPYVDTIGGNGTGGSVKVTLTAGGVLANAVTRSGSAIVAALIR